MPKETAAEPWLRVALLVRPHGIRGELVAELLTDFPERFVPGATLHLRAPQQSAPSRTATVTQARLHAGRLLLRLSGCTTREAAEALRDWELLVPWEERAPVEEGSIYLADLVGATLIDRTSDTTLGVVTGVDRESSSSPAGGMELLVVTTPGGAEHLIPFARAYQPAWETESRRLTLTLPEGLLALD